MKTIKGPAVFLAQFAGGGPHLQNLNDMAKWAKECGFIGVQLPSGSDWNTPGGTKGNIRYFDTDGDNALGKGDIRFYDTGEGPEVECASCHDPHGVPSGAAGSKFNTTFLRVENTGSAVCLTCHNK